MKWEDAMAPAPGYMTVQEYLRTPENLRPAELRYGILHVAESPTPRHQSAVLELTLVLTRHVRERKLGQVWVSPLDVILDERRALVVQPDLMFISNDRAGIVSDRVRGAPDLVIEVLSPHPRIGSTEQRIGWFAEYGARECWLVHQDRRDVTVLAFADRRVSARTVFRRDAPIHSQVLPEFSLTLDEIAIAN
jgi:Uma2 family endonuclease